jgi:hypothetical protein
MGLVKSFSIVAFLAAIALGAFLLSLWRGYELSEEAMFGRRGTRIVAIDCDVDDGHAALVDQSSLAYLAVALSSPENNDVPSTCGRMREAYVTFADGRRAELQVWVSADSPPMIGLENPYSWFDESPRFLPLHGPVPQPLQAFLSRLCGSADFGLRK